MQCSPPVSVSVEESPTVVEECQPAVQCSPPVSVSVEEESHPAVQCNPPGTVTAKDRPSAAVDEVDERQSIPVWKKKSLKIKRPQKAKRNCCELEVIENKQLIEGNEELATFMRLYWSSIRTFIRRGTVQNVFNFYFDRDFQDMVESIAVSIMKYRKNRFKINYGFGYVLKNIDTSQIRYYHVSNNNLMLDTAMLISTEAELINWLNTLTEQDFLANINRPDTKWRIVQITNVTFFVNKLIDTPLSAQCQLPDFITFNWGLANVSGAQNLSLFRCLAIFKWANPRYCERDAKDLFTVYCSHFGNEFNGVTLECLLKLEDLFKVNIVVYSLDGRVASLEHRSREIYDQTLKVNVYQNHLSVIKDFEKYCAVFQCKTCSKLWYGRNHYSCQCRTCTAKVREIYSGGIYTSTPTIFEKLEEINVFVPPKDRFYPYFACYDFESFFDHNNLPKNGEMLSFETRRRPLRVAIGSNVPGHEEAICLISNGNKKNFDSRHVAAYGGNS